MNLIAWNPRSLESVIRLPTQLEGPIAPAGPATRLESARDGPDNPGMETNLAPPSRRWAVAIAAAAALLAPSTLLSAQEAAPPDDAKPADQVVAALIEAHNQERAREKLPPLRFAPLLEVAALAHARDMAGRDVMSHEGSDGSTASQRIVRSGYRFQAAGENVAQGYRDVPAVMRGWMDSPPHKKNVLGDFTEIGVARVEGKDGKPYWSAEFAKPMPKFDPAQAASGLFRRINAERDAAKLPKLVIDAKLARAAQDQAAGLALKKVKSPSFDGLDTRAYREVAMTAAVGQPDPDAVAKTLLDSPDHKAKLLGKFTKVGVGYAAAADDGQPFWIVLLGLPADR